MKRKFTIYVIFLFCVIGLTSCLTAGLEPLPAYEDAEINNFKFEYRWSVKEGPTDKLQVKALKVDLDIDREKNIVSAKLTVPVAEGSFSQSIRDKVTLQNIVGFCSLSTAARIEPIGNAPKLGLPADFSKNPMTYKVIAADGHTFKEWKLVITEFNK